MGFLIVLYFGLLLFLIFRICKFAGDTKLYRIVYDAYDSSLLQRDLDRLNLWSNRWQMSFNVGKCKVVHFGPRNLKFEQY